MMHAELDQLFDRLFPICRSIAGPGIRESLEIIKDYIPINVLSVPTGTQVYDWVIPQEWELEYAELRRTNGEVVLSTKESNLHVLNYSVPFSGRIPRAALEENLHSIPTLPDATPYVTSYYNARWGLCLPEALRQTLSDDEYDVEIVTRHFDGVLNYGECVLPGESKQTVLITSYLCHPSMANNELSGPLALVALYKKLAAMQSRRFSYRFLLIPETIGSIAYLATRKDEIEKDIVGGCVLTCMGGPKDKISLKLSRQDWVGTPSPIDTVAHDLAALDPGLFATRPFTPTGGSDERQFCSPGINWPVIQGARTIYGDYEEYHTSHDNKSFMRIGAVVEAAERMHLLLRVHELAGLKLHSTITGGEPQLGRRGLYPTLNGPMTNRMSNDSHRDGRFALNLLLEILSLADGSMTVADIAKKLGVGFTDILPILSELREKNVIEVGE